MHCHTRAKEKGKCIDIGKGIHLLSFKNCELKGVQDAGSKRHPDDCI